MIAIVCKTCNEVIEYVSNEKVSTQYSYCKNCKNDSRENR